MGEVTDWQSCDTTDKMKAGVNLKNLVRWKQSLGEHFDRFQANTVIFHTEWSTHTQLRFSWIKSYDSTMWTRQVMMMW